MEIHPDKFYTLNEVAGILRLSRNTVAGLLARGELQGAKIGPKQWRIKGSDVLAYYERRKPEKGADTSE